MRRRILCYGDSNTYGYDPRSYLGGRYPESIRWTALLNTVDWEVINEGENGRAIPRLKVEIEAVIQSVCHSKADALVIMLGSNDLLQQPCPSAVICAERMANFLSILLFKTSADLKVLLIAPTMGSGAWVSKPRTLPEARRLAECYETIAHRLGIGFADAETWGIELAYDGAGQKMLCKRGNPTDKGKWIKAVRGKARIARLNPA